MNGTGSDMPGETIAAGGRAPGIDHPAGAVTGPGRIIHISCDYPDSVEPAKTRAIETLVSLVDDRFDHQVISLNRISPGPAFAARILANPLRPRIDIEALAPTGAITPVIYRAPPKGICHAGALLRLGEWLAARIANGPRPALLVGHKLAVEGLAVRHAARLLGVPYALSIQGDTDLKITTARPDLRPALARCFHEAAMVFPFAPWALRRVEALLGKRAGPSTVIPCPSREDRLLAPRLGGQGLVSVFHLQSWQRKNLVTMVAACDRLNAGGQPVSLGVVGGGSPEQRARCEAAIAGARGVALEGALAYDRVPERINRACGFLLPSRRESFGLVFVEALHAGTPIAYPADFGVDGYFDGAPFALRVSPDSVDEVADAMARLVRDESALKHALAEWQGSPAAHRFRREAIAADFARGLTIAATAPTMEGTA